MLIITYGSLDMSELSQVLALILFIVLTFNAFAFFHRRSERVYKLEQRVDLLVKQLKKANTDIDYLANIQLSK